MIPRVFMVWGLKAQVLDDCGFAELECDGSTKFGELIDMDDTSNQQAIEVVYVPAQTPWLNLVMGAYA